MSQPPLVGEALGVPTGYGAVARAIADGTHDPSWLEDALAEIEACNDGADHRMMTVLALVLDGGNDLPEVLREGIDHALLGFRYWMDEVGSDSMCHWSESHQVVFSVCEYLAGSRFPDRLFRRDGRTGEQKAARARLRLLEWLGNRFRHGNSEWLSGTFHAIKISALTLLVEHCEDEDLSTRASMVLDLLLLDLALHRFDGQFIASAGRADVIQKTFPGKCEIAPIVVSAFGGGRPDLMPGEYTSIFLARRRYQVPAVLQEIAQADADHLITSSHGLDLREVPHEVARMRDLDAPRRRDALVNLYWGMEAFTTPDSIGPTMEAFERYHLEENEILQPLSALRRVPSRRMMGAVVRSVNPITQGTALQRANVQTYRTPHYLLSSAQHYQPGGFGDQENVWVAALPGNIQVFSTHPGSTMLGGRPATPSGWIGNGIKPDVAQMRNVLLVLHDLRGRRGYLEGRRHELSHLYFPAANFDETRLTERMVAGRRDDSYFGALSLNRIEMTRENELVQRGVVTGWAVIVADRSDFGSLHHFVDYLRSTSLDLVRDTLVWQMPEHRHELAFQRSYTVDGALVDSDYARLRSDWTSVGRKPSVVEVRGRRGNLVLDWKLGQRTQGPMCVRARA